MENAALRDSPRRSSTIDHVADTAYWVAWYRVLETQRPDALFRDPLAARLVGDRGRTIAQSMGVEARYTQWTLVMRTRVIDALIEQLFAEGYRTVINIGAGLDTRPYRLAMPSSVHWIELDFPAVMRGKEVSLADEAPHCRLERIGVDLTNGSERRRTFDALAARVGPAVVLTEGVMPYLTEALAEELARDLRRSGKFERWITEYYSPKLYKRFQNEGFKRRMGGAPFRFFPEDFFALMAKAGWERQALRYLFDEGESTGRTFPMPGPIRLLLRVLAGKRRFAEAMRLQSYVVLRPGS